MKKLITFFWLVFVLGAMVFCQEYAKDPTRTKSSIKVDYPSTGDSIIMDTLCPIRWTRTGLQKNTVKIWFVKPGYNQYVIADGVPNTGKYYWSVYCNGPLPGSYKIKIKAGTLTGRGGFFNIIKPELTPYEPLQDKVLTIGYDRKIKWHATNAEGMKIIIYLNVRMAAGWQRYLLAKNIPANQKEWPWVVGKSYNNSQNIWGNNPPDASVKCSIQISKMPKGDGITGCFFNKGPHFYVIKYHSPD